MRRASWPPRRRFLWVATWAAVLPFVMNTAGWLLTESGRQPWIVQGIKLTKNGVSPSVSTTEIAISLGVFVALYIVLGVVDLLLMLRYSREELAPERRADRRRTPASRPCSTEGGDEHRPVLVHPRSPSCGSGFFVLEGFDFGVGMLHGVVGRDEAGRRAAINTIGPLWDGNEVWLVVAGAAMFAAFPAWYATMFSGFYLALVLLLVALIVRGVSFEYRGKRDVRALAADLGRLLAAGSLVAPLLLGVALGDLLHGLPIDASQEFTGTFWRPAAAVRRCSPASRWSRSACCTARRSWP